MIFLHGCIPCQMEQQIIIMLPYVGAIAIFAWRRLYNYFSHPDCEKDCEHDTHQR